MFTKETKDMSTKDAETIIGQSIKVKGNFHGQGNIIVEGQVEGSIKTGGHLYVGKKARITADINAKEAKIGGEINGNISVEGYLELTAQAKVFGDITASELSVERGAQINGNCQMGSQKQSSNADNAGATK